MNSFNNKVAVITGRNSGIGLATAKELHRRGGKIVISRRDEKSLTEAAADIGGDTLAVKADVSRLGDLNNLFAQVQKQHGKIDVLCANAGVAKFAPVNEATEARFDENMDNVGNGRKLDTTSPELIC